ncbi:MAG: Na+/H+ antiporter subunit E [Candidatus Omnitrophota bacterium]
MKRRIILFLVSLLIWCLLVWVPDVPRLLLGILISIFVAVLTADLFVIRPQRIKHPLRYWYFVFYYLPVFIWECIKANIDVAYRVLHPRLPIKPGIVKVKTSLKSDTGLTFLANSITLTPGTLTVDIDAERGILYVHWINVKEKDTDRATELIVKRFENILKKIFD